MREETNFDAGREIAISMQSPTGPKRIVLRFPTDDEWIERQRKRKVIVKQLGRGISETIVPDYSTDDLKFAASIRVDKDGPEIDEYEAQRIIDQLSLSEVDDVQQESPAFVVSLRVAGAVTRHYLRMPSAKDIIRYKRSFARILDLPFSRQEVTVNLNAASELYKSISERTENYTGAVPVIHQATVVKAVLESLESGFGVAGSENF